MAVIYSWSGSVSTAPDFTAGTTPATIVTAGTYGERYAWAASTTAQNLQKTGLTIAGDFGLRTIYTIASAAGSSHAVMFAVDAALATIFRVDMTTTGLLRIRNTANATVDATVALAYGVEHRIEAYRVSGTMTLKAYRVSDDTLITTVTSAAGAVTGTVARVGWGNNATLTGTLGAFTHDEMVITDVGAEVGAPAGTLAATMTVAPISGAAPLAVTATVTATGGTGTAKTYSWVWGDGGTTAAQASNVASHTYTVAGEYDPVCTVANT